MVCVQKWLEKLTRINTEVADLFGHLTFGKLLFSKLRKLNVTTNPHCFPPPTTRIQMELPGLRGTHAVVFYYLQDEPPWSSSRVKVCSMSDLQSSTLTTDGQPKEGSIDQIQFEGIYHPVLVQEVYEDTYLHEVLLALHTENAKRRENRGRRQVHLLGLTPDKNTLSAAPGVAAANHSKETDLNESVDITEERHGSTGMPHLVRSLPDAVTVSSGPTTKPAVVDIKLELMAEQAENDRFSAEISKRQLTSLQTELQQKESQWKRERIAMHAKLQKGQLPKQHEVKGSSLRDQLIAFRAKCHRAWYYYENDIEGHPCPSVDDVNEAEFARLRDLFRSHHKTACWAIRQKLGEPIVPSDRITRPGRPTIPKLRMELCFGLLSPAIFLALCQCLDACELHAVGDKGMRTFSWACLTEQRIPDVKRDKALRKLFQEAAAKKSVQVLLQACKKIRLNQRIKASMAKGKYRKETRAQSRSKKRPKSPAQCEESDEIGEEDSDEEEMEKASTK